MNSKKLVFTLVVLLSVLAAQVAGVWNGDSASAAVDGVDYVCPDGQSRGKRGANEDIRYCYSGTATEGSSSGCPAGQVRGNTGRLTGGDDPDKCYTEHTGSNIRGTYYTEEGPFNAGSPGKGRTKHNQVKLVAVDDKHCPVGLFRGDISYGTEGDNLKDVGTCFDCTKNSCSSTSDALLPSWMSSCRAGNKGRDCRAEQQQDTIDLMERASNSAPDGYVFPPPGAEPSSISELEGTVHAKRMCSYYITPELDGDDWRYIQKACYLGYEVGYGGGVVCSEKYLVGARNTDAPAPNHFAHETRQYLLTIDERSRRTNLRQAARAACIEGWTQYKVDYWYCNGNSACQQGLRSNKARVYDPGPAPTRAVDNQQGNKPTPAGILQQTGNSSKSCGSIQTAYFACGGNGQTIENSGFWQMIQTVLNVLLGIIAIAAVGGLVYGGIRYSKAQDDSNEVIAARNIVKNVIIGLVLYVAMWALIEYLIPGGILS